MLDQWKGAKPPASPESQFAKDVATYGHLQPEEPPAMPSVRLARLDVPFGNLLDFAFKALLAILIAGVAVAAVVWVVVTVVSNSVGR